MTLPSRKILARGGSLGVAAVLAASTLAALPVGSAQAAGVDPQPSTAGVAWLRANTTGASVPDTLEAALGLRVAGDGATSAALRDATAAVSGAYTGVGPGAEPDPTARVAWYVQQLGGNATAYGTSGNLIATLDGLVGTDGRLTKGLSALTEPTVAGQVFAASALAAAGNTKAVTYTASLQCPAGFFNDALPAVGATTTCDPAPAKQSVQATALFALGMRGVAAAAPSVTKALDWLAKEQQSNGRWVANGGAGAGDSTSTALAAYALAASGRTGAAAQGAVWLRGNQLANAGTCAAFPATDVGAVAPDGGVYTGTAGRVPDFRLATARSLLVLGSAPGGPGVTDNVLTVPQFSQPGRTLTATVRSAPRNLICASATTLAATRVLTNYDSTADFTFAAGAGGTATATITDASGQVDTASTTVLAKKKLAFSFRDKRVRSGRNAVVKVRGLAPGESVKVLLRGGRKASTVAKPNGQAKLRFRASGKRGTAKVKVVGQYNNRSRVKNIIIVRR